MIKQSVIQGMMIMITILRVCCTATMKTKSQPSTVCTTSACDAMKKRFESNLPSRMRRISSLFATQQKRRFQQQARLMLTPGYIPITTIQRYDRYYHNRPDCYHILVKQHRKSRSRILNTLFASLDRFHCHGMATRSSPLSSSSLLLFSSSSLSFRTTTTTSQSTVLKDIKSFHDGNDRNDNENYSLEEIDISEHDDDQNSLDKGIDDLYVDQKISDRSLDELYYASDYHVPVMWKECISSLLDCRRGLVRQPKRQHLPHVEKNVDKIPAIESDRNGRFDNDGRNKETLEAENSPITWNNKVEENKTVRTNEKKSKQVKPIKKLSRRQRERLQQQQQEGNGTSSIQPLLPVIETTTDSNTNTNRSNVVFVDGTLGGGGHANALLNVLQPGDIVFGCDVDSDALHNACQRLESYCSRNNNNNKDDNSTDPTIGTTGSGNSKATFIPVQSNFCDLTLSKLVQAAFKAGGSDLEQHVKALLLPTTNHTTTSTGTSRGGVDGILLDLGVSSYQIDTAERGFAYRQNGPLDMRLSNGSSASTNSNNTITGTTIASTLITAADICNEMDSNELRRIFQLYGDEPRSRKISEAIVQHRPLYTTQDLYNAVATVVPEFAKNSRRLGRTATMARIFQSLRIVVNQEDIVLHKALKQMAPSLIRTGGRLVVLSYHSMEDRMTKQIIRDGYSFGKRQQPNKNNSMPFRNKNNKNDDDGDDNDNDNDEILPFRPVGKKVKATDEEVEYNNRARSATLRVAERL